MSRIITCEQVSNGHPDKIADQIADAVVTECLKNDEKSRVAIECLVKDNCIVIAGELTSQYKPEFEKTVDSVLNKIGANKLDYHGAVNIFPLVSQQSGDIAMGVDTGGAGDQGMMYGYATNETPEMLPIPYVLSTEFLMNLRDLNDDRLKADAKAQVSFDYETGKITTFLCSVQHVAECEPKDFREDIENLMRRVAKARGFNDDFRTLVNPTGRFVTGGSFADCGVTGRKLACDTYGGVGKLGGGALSGKDPSKVDRSGAYMARRIAKDCVLNGYCSNCEVQIAYAIGVAEPVSVNIETFGGVDVNKTEIENYIRDTYDLTPRGIIRTLGLLGIDYNEVSSYGHFMNQVMPWERLER